MNRLKFLAFILLLDGCGKTDAVQPLEYDGPQREAEKVEMHYSENEVVKVRMLADLVYEYQVGDREFPKGIYMEFFNELGVLSSTLRANHAYYSKKDNTWKATGKVEVINLEKNEQLNTEELFWRPDKEQIYTESFVTIRMQTEVIYGEGLEAKQDMSSYTIKKPQGEFTLEEGTETPGRN
ncbi:MAG: LPS export ABC transporter periplasmic protein LptC [Cyclobacteriaceae bacterium]|nr:LPS export ABC transporter periplasmic protein LptC [Cyclobacteriaceae bacterium]UYN88619.1 MAG: LPS export ABC transporter periplasmic protein LptC [Cyclobacteriaceae bacterium]